VAFECDEPFGEKGIFMEITEGKAYAENIISRARSASLEFATFNQEQVDRIVEAVFKCAFNHRILLAEKAFRETGIGVLEHKIIKNSWASLRVYKDIQHRKTVGVIASNELTGISEIAHPMGVILALTPVTNPTATTIQKILIAMKTRNAIVFSPHRAAKKSSRMACELLAQAAEEAGAPVGCISHTGTKGYKYLDDIMAHPHTCMILATGTPEVVRKAQKSGKPTLGSGPGNVPIYVDSSADFTLAADSIIRSKTFDNGCVCSSEQALIVTRETDAGFQPLLRERGCYFCNQEETRALAKISYDPLQRRMRAAVVGQSAIRIAEMAGFEVPPETCVLMTRCSGIGKEYPCSQEILAPVLAYFVVGDFREAREHIQAIENQGGLGHTLSLFCNDESVIEAISSRSQAGRILVNSPSTQGAIGGLFNHINPSLTLSCGASAGQVIVDNISVTNLIHIHKLARRRLNHQWYSVPREDWMNPEIDADHILVDYDWNY